MTYVVESGCSIVCTCGLIKNTLLFKKANNAFVIFLEMLLGGANCLSSGDFTTYLPTNMINVKVCMFVYLLRQTAERTDIKFGTGVEYGLE